MKALWLVVALFLVPLVPAQDLPEALEGLDPSGDVELFAPDGTSLGTTDQLPHLDVLGGRVSKADSGDMAFEILLEDPSYAQREDRDGDLETSIALYFDFGAIRYYVDYGDWRRDVGEACLTRFIDEERFDGIECFETTLVEEWLRVEIPGHYITDEVGAILRHPAQLDAIHAEGRMDQILFFEDIGYARAIDRAPDDGEWGAILTPPDPGAGPLLVNPLERIRGSNGGPEVIVFHVLVDNIAPDPLSAVVTVGDLPEEWGATAPARIQVDPGATRDVPVIVTVPAFHQHGTTHRFNVTVALEDGTSWTEDLGVHFFTVAQPAGHHDTLFLHGQQMPDFVRTWMDTIAEHDTEDGSPAGAATSSSSFPPTHRTAFYHIGMAPDLLIGLDFLTDRPVETDLAVTTDLGGEATVRVVLDHCNPFDNSGRSYSEYGGDLRCPGSWFPLAERTETLMLEAGTTPLAWDLPVTEYADLVPPAPGALLALHLEITRLIADGTADRAMLQTTGSSLRLPLAEYRDPLDDEMAALAGLRIAGLEELTLAPGSQVWRPLTIQNDADADRTLRFEVFGHNAGWAAVRPTQLRVPAGGEAVAQVGVTVPEGADAADRADLFIVATDASDEAITIAHDLRVAVNPAQPRQVEEAPSGTADTPAVAAPLVLVALAVLAFRRR